MRPFTFIAAPLLCAACAGGCGGESALSADAGVGPRPVLPAPSSTLIPTLNIAPATGWPADGKPVAADGLEVRALARGLAHPRMLHVLPNGDVLVAESNAPAKHDANGGVMGWIRKNVMKSAGAGVVSADRITLLRDIGADGVARTRTVFIDGLHSPFGMALVGDALYVANTDAVLRFPYRTGDTRIATAGTKVMDLPAGPINHHWTKDLVASADGTRLYVSVGSNSNIGENGLAAETGRASIHEFDITSGRARIFAGGLRNANGLAWQPQTGALWAVVNERDELGNDLVPDYLTGVRDGAFYGWPYSYYGQHVDVRMQPAQPALVATAIAPDYALGSHVAPLGLAFSNGELLPGRFRNGAFVGEHGSWNRKPHSGYKVVFIAFEGGLPVGLPQDVLTGFLSAGGEARGRPVGVAMDRSGALLVADDVGNIIWRVTAASP